MPIAATNNVAVRIIEEATFGTTPSSPALKELRYTSESLIANKESVVSEVIRSDRQRDFLAEVAATGEGDLNIELAFGDELDLMLRGVLQDEFSIHHIGTGDALGPEIIGTTAPADPAVDGGTFDTTSSALTAGLTVGQLIDAAGTVTNNGRYKIKAISSDGLTVTVEPNIGAAPVTTEAGSGDETLTNTALGLDVTAATRTIVRDDAINWEDDGYAVGMWVRLTGFTVSSGANNGIYKIESLTTTSMVVATGFGNQANLVDETGSGDEQAFAKKIKNGTTPRSYSIEKEYSDITQFQTFEGMRFANMAMTVEVGSIVSAVLNLQGEGNVQMAAARTSLPTNGATVVGADTTEQMNATSNVGNLFEGGSALTTCLQSIAFTIENNMRMVNCIGQKFPQEVNSGFVDVTGTIEASFEDAVLFNKFVQHTQSSLEFSFTDAAGNVVVVTLPRIFYATGSPTTPGGNEEVELSLEFTAIREQTATGKTIEFDILPATLP